jgi:hypothetical protein
MKIPRIGLETRDVSRGKRRTHPCEVLSVCPLWISDPDCKQTVHLLGNFEGPGNAKWIMFIAAVAPHRKSSRNPAGFHFTPKGPGNNLNRLFEDRTENPDPRQIRRNHMKMDVDHDEKSSTISFELNLHIVRKCYSFQAERPLTHTHNPH